MSEAHETVILDGFNVEQFGHDDFVNLHCQCGRGFLFRKDGSVARCLCGVSYHYDVDRQTFVAARPAEG